MSSFNVNQNVYAVTANVATTKYGDFRPRIFLEQNAQMALLTNCTWSQEGSTAAPQAGVFLPATPAGTTQLAVLINQDPVGYVSVVGANGANYRLQPNGGCLVLTSSTLGITGPNGASNWQVLSVDALGNPNSVTTQLDFFFAGF